MRFSIDDIVFYENKYAWIKELNRKEALIVYFNLYSEEWVKKEELIRIKQYKLSELYANKLYNLEIDLVEYFPEPYFLIKNDITITPDLSELYRIADTLNSLSDEYKIRWINLILQTLDLLFIEDIDLYILLRRIEKASDNYNDVIETILEHKQNLILPFKDRYTDPKEMKLILQTMFESNEICEFDDGLKEAYILYLENECFKKDLNVLHIKAYSYYGGNNIVECDYYKAAEALHDLVEIGHTYAANSLGYIYYYGKINEGIPEYEKAFKYFTISALDGEPEAIYKLSDMFKNGYGVSKNYKLAFKLLKEIEYQELNKLESNTYNKYADIALRLASIYENGYFVEQSNELAYFYYLRASLAMDIRNKHYPIFGDDVVNERVTASLERISNKIKKINKITRIEFLLSQIMSDNTVEIISNYNSNNELVLTIKSLTNKRKFIVDPNNHKKYFTNKMVLIIDTDEEYDIDEIFTEGRCWNYNMSFIIEDEENGNVIEIDYKNIKIKLYNELK